MGCGVVFELAHSRVIEPKRRGARESPNLCPRRRHTPWIRKQSGQLDSHGVCSSCSGAAPTSCILPVAAWRLPNNMIGISPVSAPHLCVCGCEIQRTHCSKRHGLPGASQDAYHQRQRWRGRQPLPQCMQCFPRLPRVVNLKKQLSVVLSGHGSELK
jgi:hypothetical protein